MSEQLFADADVSLARLEGVDGADVVQTSARHEAAGRGVGTRHHPAGAEGDGVDLGRV